METAPANHSSTLAGTGKSWEAPEEAAPRLGRSAGRERPGAQPCQPGLCQLQPPLTVPSSCSGPRSGLATSRRLPRGIPPCQRDPQGQGCPQPQVLRFKCAGREETMTTTTMKNRRRFPAAAAQSCRWLGRACLGRLRAHPYWGPDGTPCQKHRVALHSRNHPLCLVSQVRSQTPAGWPGQGQGQRLRFHWLHPHRPGTARRAKPPAVRALPPVG